MTLGVDLSFDISVTVARAAKASCDESFLSDGTSRSIISSPDQVKSYPGSVVCRQSERAEFQAADTGAAVIAFKPRRTDYHAAAAAILRSVIAGRRMLEQSFVVVLTRTGGQWFGHSRDFPHIQIKGRSAESTYVETASAVRREIHRLWAAGQPLPAFRSYADVRIDDAFARERGIQWPRAIVRMAALPEQVATASSPPLAGAAGEAEPLTRAS